MHREAFGFAESPIKTLPYFAVILEITPLEATSSPYTAIMLYDQILFHRPVILHYTIPKPYGSGLLRQSITGFFKYFWSEGKIACQGGVGGLKHMKRNDISPLVVAVVIPLCKFGRM